MSNYLSRDINEINELLKTKKIKVRDLLDEAYSKIDEEVNAFITLTKEEAYQQADKLDQMEVDNLLFGLPIIIKDNIITKDIATTCASKMLEDFIPVYDATVIKKIKEKNMVIIAKANMDEFAMGSRGQTSYFGDILNPLNKDLVPGGSSSGSAAGVAMGVSPFALGSDTGGSIRQPAAFCSCVGMKPTYGAVSRYGLIAFASSLDVIGPISNNVYNNALLLNAIQGFDKNDLSSEKDNNVDNTALINSDINKYKIAVPKFYLSDIVSQEIREEVEKVIKKLTDKGLTIDYIDIDNLDMSVALYQVIALAEASSNLARFDGIKFGYQTSNFTDLDSYYKNTREEGFGNEVKKRILVGTYVLSSAQADKYYKKALKIRKALCDSLTKVLEDYDFIIGPVTTRKGIKREDKNQTSVEKFYDDLLTIPANMAGLPALSLPIAKEGISLQIMGNYFEESKIYALASVIEKEVNL